MKIALILAGAVSLSGLLSPFVRPSNSQALSEQGVEQWSREEYAESAKSFERSRELRTTSAATFDLGTALVGARDHQRGEEILHSLVGDDEMAVRSWYNMGNSQLLRDAFDDAIDSYVRTLRLEPSHMGAKRNLEIALKRREQSQQQSGSGEGEEEGPREAPGESEREPASLDADLEHVLRSIDQQEQEELSRMRRARALRRPTDW